MVAAGNRDADSQTLSDADSHVYEAIATLEFLGRAATRDAILSVAALDDATVGRILASLAERGLVRAMTRDGAVVFEPASRDWSTAPEQAPGAMAREGAAGRDRPAPERR
jgi:hypothetical protein